MYEIQNEAIRETRNLHALEQQRVTLVPLFRYNSCTESGLSRVWLKKSWGGTLWDDEEHANHGEFISSVRAFGQRDLRFGVLEKDEERIASRTCSGFSNHFSRDEKGDNWGGSSARWTAGCNAAARSLRLERGRAEGTRRRCGGGMWRGFWVAMLS